MNDFEKDHTLEKDIEYEIISPILRHREKITATYAAIFLIFVSSV